MRSFFILLLFFPVVCFGQFTDNFTDGDFTNDPAWMGDTDKFIINTSYELQLNAEAVAGTAYLSTGSEAIYEAGWEFLVKMRFTPSSSNYCDVYLVSNSSDLNSVTNGYFVRLGNTTRDICLYKKTPSTSIKIIDGVDNRINSTSVNVRVKVTRDLDGNWDLMTDTLGGTGYFNEGSVFDDTYTRSSYFGVVCKYTQTRSQHFHFDDFIVTGTGFVDNDPPLLLSARVIDNNKILLAFDEELDSGTALSTGNYNVNNGINNPVSAVFYESNRTQVLLEFSTPFVSPGNYTLTYENIEDLNGNVIESGSVNFSYVIITPGMIVINEIMAKPDPVVNLPDAEYVELYNTTGFTINLNNWVYQIGSESNRRTLTEFQLEPGGYLILCHINNASLFEVYGNTLGISGFPAINNTSQTIILYDDNENIIDKVTYSDSWYKDSEKKKGGWSLEKIDPSNTCSPDQNWIASNNENGGTPGIINSVYAENVDDTPPVVLSISAASASEINIVFSELTDTLTSLDINNYYLAPDFGNPIHAYVNPDNTNAVIIQFEVSFDQSLSYLLTVENIADLCGNIMERQQLNLSFQNVKEYDVVICEIMARPEPVVLLPNVKYIELYNRTSDDIELTSWTISLGNGTPRAIPYCVIPSGSYMVICNQDAAGEYSGIIDNIVGVAGFPSLTTTGGTLVLRNNDGFIIHTVTYSDNWYNDQFKKKGGYSLEMIDTDNPCEGIENWTATVDVSGGTPGRENSVKGINPDLKSPYPYAIDILTPDTLVVYFSEILRPEYANNANNFNITEFGNPVWLNAAEPNFSVVTMKFSSGFEAGRVYYLDILDSIRDCSNNLIPSNTSVRFAIGDSVVKNDIVINEILFYPNTGGKDFVELYNRSEKVLDLKSLWLSNRDASGNPDNTVQISTVNRLLLPGEYCAVTTDTLDLENNYHILFPENLFQANSIPSMPSDYGSVILTDRYMNIIDDVNYDKSQHYKLLSSQRGVSLERMDFDRPSGDLSNWHSASQVAGFATPGYQNSQYTPGIAAESAITLTPKVFSPDNDGIDDRLTISYKLDEPGYTATMSIYGSNGNFITHVINNEMLGTEGNLFWDGFDEGNIVCPMGIYILYVEMFNLSGKKIIEKHAIVLSVKK